MKTRKLLICLCVLFICVGCSQTSAEVDTGTNEYNYLLVSANNTKNRENIFLFHQVKEETNTDISIHSEGDLSYTKYNEYNNMYYFFGPGGLVEADLNKKEINQLSDKDINEISFNKAEIFVYENTGLTSKIYALNSKLTLELDYSVASFEVFDNKIYVVNSIASDEEKQHLYIYENNTLIDTIPLEDASILSSDLFLDNTHLYFMSNNYALDLSTNERFTFIDENNNELYLDDPYHSFIYVGDTLFNIQCNPENNIVTIYRVKENDSNFQFAEIDVIAQSCINFSYSGGKEIVLASNDNTYLIYNLINKETQEVKVENLSDGWNSKIFILINEE